MIYFVGHILHYLAMDRSYPYTQRIARRARGRRPFAALVLLGLAGCAVALVMRFGPDPIAAATDQATQQAAPPALASAQGQLSTRRVYPYSVVPGGVASQAELVRIVRSDKVVAAHYASFDLSRAHAVTVAKPRAVHVSYRKGNQVYWTAKKVMLREGETLLSDGRNEMRTRCANRVSDVAQFPVEAQEPSAELLDTAFEEDLADAEEGRRINASMDLAEELALAWTGQQPQLPALPGATAGEVASSTIGRSAGAAPGAMPLTTALIGNRTVAQAGAAVMPGALAHTEATASAGGVSTAPALVVAMDAGQTNGAASSVSGDPGTAATQPELAVTPKPGAAASVPPATVDDATSRPIELPEPGTAWLVALALGSMLVLRKKP